MTKHKPSSVELHKCAWCGYPEATHQGGYETRTGTKVEEWFCCKEHYEKWLTWQAALALVKAQTRISQFNEPAKAVP